LSLKLGVVTQMITQDSKQVSQSTASIDTSLP